MLSILRSITHFCASNTAMNVLMTQFYPQTSPIKYEQIFFIGRLFASWKSVKERWKIICLQKIKVTHVTFTAMHKFFIIKLNFLLSEIKFTAWAFEATKERQFLSFSRNLFSSTISLSHIRNLIIVLFRRISCNKSRFEKSLNWGCRSDLFRFKTRSW